MISEANSEVIKCSYYGKFWLSLYLSLGCELSCQNVRHLFGQYIGHGSRLKSATHHYHSRLKSVASSVTHNTKKACFAIKTWEASKHISSVQQINKAVLHTTQRKHALSSKHTGGHPNMGVFKPMGGVITYGGHPNMWGSPNI